MINIVWDVSFKRSYKKRISNDTVLKKKFWEALELFIDDPDHTSLRNHSLRNKFSGFRSIDVTDDYRALFKIQKTKTI